MNGDGDTDKPEPGDAVPPVPPRGRLSWFRRALVALLIVGIAMPVGLTAVYRFAPPPITLLMVQRMIEGRGLDKRWRPISRISPSLVEAAIASEDSRFCSHMGFDVEAIRRAFANNERRPSRIRGGSTISQQTAKNVFLWLDRSYVRKGLEAYFTLLIEGLWGKRRIMEVYLNVAEWGPGIYGAEAAAQHYFGVPASRLTRVQASRLAAVLPSPLRYRAAAPGPYVARRSRAIAAAAQVVRNEGLAACVTG
jgi:monofunctional biosynthetic peptidoglycan transglycosylase